MADKHSEGYARCRSDHETHQYISQIVLADEYPAYPDHCGPEEYPPSVSFDPPWGFCAFSSFEAALQTDECAECESERVGGMCGKESVFSSFFQEYADLARPYIHP